MSITNRTILSYRPLPTVWNVVGKPFFIARARLLLIAAATVPCLQLHAVPVFVDQTNPTGLPDITQGNAGICAATAMANVLWEWSEHAPYDGSTGGKRLVEHPDSVTPAQNWPATWGNWSQDSILLRHRLSELIHGKDYLTGGNNGQGTVAGTQRYIESRGHLYSSGFFGWGANPDGLSVRTYNGDDATYANAKSWVVNNNNELVNSSVVTSWVWHNPDQTFVENNNLKSRHALAIAGIDPDDEFIYLTNGWGSHQGNADPVNTAYYDYYEDIVTDGDGSGIFRIPTGGGAQNNGRGNDYLVHGIAGSAGSDYTEMYRFAVVKKGGSPELNLNVTPSDPGYNDFTYQVYNPEPTDQHHFFLELPTRVVNSLSLGADIISPDGWDVGVWNPAGLIEDVFGNPRDGNLLFGNEYAVENGSDNPAWVPDYTGLHWYWTGAAGTPIGSGEIFDFTLRLPESIPYVLDRKFTTVVGEMNHGVHYYSMIGGPVPEPAAVALFAIAAAYLYYRGLRPQKHLGPFVLVGRVKMRT